MRGPVMDEKAPASAAAMAHRGVVEVLGKLAARPLDQDATAPMRTAVAKAGAARVQDAYAWLRGGDRGRRLASVPSLDARGLEES